MVSRDNIKFIESHVNIDVIYSYHSVEESDSGQTDIQPALKRNARLKAKYYSF